ncbi:hypothetical protein EC973_009407 [Apophysomyces ossiformis]|uniref:non-specific serine/threonine protein kinase n=1 Tax=Apophysomyces ossiformis TaxID=679940 RepID=A0A8H7BLR4_9FUNG|nr:hypothetical protein EC973_009407 [Apophysomyces ossiformis]
MSFLASLLDVVLAAVDCCIPNANISINGRAYRIVKLLGEGGFSFVYLAQDGSGNLYALKKIRCSLDSEEATLAQREIDVYRMFEHKNIIRMLDTGTVTEPDGSKTVYIFLPYYKRGNLQDAINRNNLNNTHFNEQQMLRTLREVCSAVEALHTYRAPGVARAAYASNGIAAADQEEIDDQQRRALLSEQGHHQQDTSVVQSVSRGEILPWAHRDIKPGNVLMSDDGTTPVLMDFGSACKARVEIHSRQEALAQQDIAAEHCSMPYRAPELFDVKTETTLDEKVDIWSLGCTLYAMAYGQSPFEMNMNEQGGSIALAVLNGQFKFPSGKEDLYSKDFQDLITWMLTVDPKARPDIHQVIEKLDNLLSRENR